MCVNWGLGQSISVKIHLYVGAGRNLFTEIIPEDQLESCVCHLGNQLAEFLLIEGCSHKRVDGAWEASRRGREWRVIGAQQERGGMG